MKLHEYYEKYHVSYKKLCSYQTFKEEEPKELVSRFLEHDQERQKYEAMMKEREEFLSNIEKKNAALKKQKTDIDIDLMQNSEKLENLSLIHI